jgi:hypothetical protein
MLAWLIDHAFLAYFVLGCLAAGLAAGWWATRKRPLLAGLALVAALIAVVVALTLLVDTDRKKIERTVYAMAAAVGSRSPEQLFQHVSDKFKSRFLVHGATAFWNKSDLRQAAEKARKLWDVRGVTVAELEFKSLTGSEAVVAFTAKPVLGGESYFVLPCPCEAHFAREEDGRWRLTALQIFNPFINTTDLLDLPL